MAERGVVPDQLARQSRQGRSHKDGGRTQGQQRQAEADHGQQRGVLRQGPERSAVDLVQAPEQHLRREDRHHHEQLEDGVHAQRGADPIGYSAADHGAYGHAAEEAGQDGRDRLGGVAEDQDQLASPHHFVDEARESGQQEDQQDGLLARR